MRMHQTMLLGVATVVAIAACGPAPAREAPSSTSASAPIATAPKRLVAAVMSDLPVLYAKVHTTGGTPGLDAMGDIVGAGMVRADGDVNILPQLAAAVPSVDNGLWKLMPDGTMEVTWRIREGTQWHDGTPFTADDLVFTATVVRDRELPTFRDTSFQYLDRVEAVDARTARAIWRQPFAFANSLFSMQLALPMPKHILERDYQEAKESFIDLPYWSTEYVGAGPFKVREFVRSRHIMLDAHVTYPLGKPKFDVIELRFIPDPQGLVANLLAGEVDVTVGRSISLDEAIPMMDTWRDGAFAKGFARYVRISAQFQNPNPAVIANLQFRRALLHAMDRQQMVDTLEYGLSSVAHTSLPPTRPEWREVDNRVIRYDYDLARSARMIEELGYVRGPDGFFVDAAGRPLSVELRSTASPTLSKAQLAVADGWQRGGVRVDAIPVPQQLVQNREYRVLRPGFQLVGSTLDPNELTAFHTSQLPRPETNYVGSNEPLYSSAEYDSLIERYLVTIPDRERHSVLTDMASHLVEHLPFYTLFYDIEPTMIANKLQNVGPRRQPATQAWNIHEWDVK